MSEHLPSDGLTCPVCLLSKRELRKGCFCSDPLCSECIATWYEGGTSDALWIRRHSRLSQGFVMDVNEP